MPQLGKRIVLAEPLDAPCIGLRAVCSIVFDGLEVLGMGCVLVHRRF